MKKIGFLLVAVLTSTMSFSQGIDAGVKAGATFATLTDASGLKNKTGLLAGAFVGIKFNDKIAVQPELLYSQQGAKTDVSDIELNYVNVPVVLKYYLIQGLNVQAGPQFGFVVDDNLGDAFDKKPVDVSGLIGAGYDFPLGIRIDARYHFGFTAIGEDTDSKNGVFSVALGYSFL